MSSRWKERNAETRKDCKCEEENPCQSGEDAIARDKTILSGPVAVDEERLEAAARNSAVEKGQQKDE